ncbi:MAG: TlpA family protein disulfide reductase [Planctomycetes bacterium]|nr:TlpA family protein disulfide reductase [Planctomycetota bacterium]
MNPLAAAAVIVLGIASAAAAEPLRYTSAPGDTVTYSAQFNSDTIVRRGASVERLAFSRTGTQKVLTCATENGRMLFAVETSHGPARATVYSVNGKDKLRQETERLSTTLPGPESSVDFLWLDNRGQGAVIPRDPDLADAVLRALDEIEVTPEGDEGTWDREGAVGTLAWKAAFERKGGMVSGKFTFSAPDQGGARVVFEAGKANMNFAAGYLKGVDGSVAWTIATADGTERREIRFSLNGVRGEALAAAEATDAASDAAPMIAAQEAWNDGERDRAAELWEKTAADPANRWAGRAKDRAASVRRDWPMLGKAAPAWKASSWIGPAPESGKWQLVYFWATWAPRCEPELAVLAGLLKGRTRVAGAAVTRVDALQTEDDVRRAVSRLALPFGVALEDGEASKGFKVEELPRVFLVDAEGKVRFEGTGAEKETLKAVMDRLAGE